MEYLYAPYDPFWDNGLCALCQDYLPEDDASILWGKLEELKEDYPLVTLAPYRGGVSICRICYNKLPKRGFGSLSYP